MPFIYITIFILKMPEIETKTLTRGRQRGLADGDRQRGGGISPPWKKWEKYKFGSSGTSHTLRVGQINKVCNKNDRKKSHHLKI